MAQDIYMVVLVAVSAYFLVVAVSNVVFLRRATAKPRIRSGPFVSVIVPARNEERAIARCLGSLLAQDYADYEVIVVDDQSGDATARLVADIGSRDRRVRLVTGAPLTAGWLGKPHALAQGVAVARGEILVLTDADTVHKPGSVSWAVTNLADHDADIVSGYLDQEYGSFGERLIVPTMYAAMLLVPLSLVPRTKSPGLAFAIGQYVVLRRSALDGIGGFESIRDSIVDDMSMAIRMKSLGYRNVFLDANDAARCRLYTGYREAFGGIVRSIYSAVGGRPMPAIAMSAIVLGLIVWPALWLLGSLAGLDAPPAAVALAVGLFAAQWGIVSWDRRVPLTAFVLYPAVFANLIAILNVSMVLTGFGPGVAWKGRTIRTPDNPGAARAARLADAADRSGKAR